MSPHLSARLVAATGLALFAMFFGAGNLIIPTMIGVEAGPAASRAMLGFALTGVLLPALSTIAATTVRPEERRLADRIGPRLGLLVTAAIFLGCGMIYGIPRVGAVSYEMSLAPALGGGGDGVLAADAGGAGGIAARVAYSAVFFGLAYVLTRRPSRILTVLGGWLTPLLLALLAALVVSVLQVAPVHPQPSATYARSPELAGFVQGYFTMDALAALLFAGVVIGSFTAAGLDRQAVRRGTVISAVIAAALLVAVYAGLVRVGMVGAGSNGAEVLAGVAQERFGTAGQLLFGAIVVLACLTTTIGLSSASAQFFHELWPRLSEHAWLTLTLGVSFLLSNLGLEAILAVVAPINQLLYPIVICLILVALLEVLLRGVRAGHGAGRLHWAYRLPAWVAGLLSVPEALWSTQAAVFAPLRQLLDAFPLGELQLAWVVPALVALAVGLLVDLTGRRPTAAA
ncbi:branched-chain amino acid transport system II carrier protein [Brachybacterium sp. EF45031]|uniref:branched-chain amino acid transport system II carrier protein n=1 Tax=Brachybacterium sillae TaxID=2810536 RepID=UPI00217D9468|nr:branched-chain amino acid transport system II carrier protein [Brachybacterium sillae]MCS6711959.1 branched-chain amino acid transport system II carrier protein [Brachybacterium sillae]